MAAEGSSHAHGVEEVEIDRPAMIKQIHTAPVVDIQAFITNRPTELIQQIFEKFEQQGLHRFLTAEPSNIYPEMVMEYYWNMGLKRRLGEIYSTIGRTRISITKEVLSTHLGLSTEGVDVRGYKAGKESELWHLICKPGRENEFRLSAKKDDIQKDFLAFMDIVSKVIEGRTGSYDMFSALKMRIMLAIWDGVKVDWAGFLLSRLMEEKEKAQLSADKTRFIMRPSYGTLLTFLLEKLGVKPIGKAVKITTARRMGRIDFAEIQRLAKESVLVNGEARLNILYL